MRLTRVTEGYLAKRRVFVCVRSKENNKHVMLTMRCTLRALAGLRGFDGPKDDGEQGAGEVVKARGTM